MRDVEGRKGQREGGAERRGRRRKMNEGRARESFANLRWFPCSNRIFGTGRI